MPSAETDTAKPHSPPMLSPDALVLVAGILAYILLDLAVCLTTIPLTDEGLVSNPAFNLATRGVMSTTIFDDQNTPDEADCATLRDCLLKASNLFRGHHESYVGMRHYTYWVMPVYLLIQAAWYRLAGFGVFQARVLALFWGPLLIFACYSLIRDLFGGTRAASIAVVLLVTDMTVLASGAFARMDMFCAALGYSALAVYVHLRRARLGRAVFLSNVLAAIACFAHPISALAVVGLVMIALSLDARRLRLRHVGLALAPYLVGALAWASYIARAPTIFLSQVLANASGRGSKLFSPLAAIQSELLQRYGPKFGFGPLTSDASHAKILVLGLFFAGCLIAFITWRSWTREARVLFGLLATYAFLLTFAEGMKFNFYLIHIIPLYVCTCAVVAGRALDRPGGPRVAAYVCLLAILVVNLSWWINRVRANAYDKDFVPVAEFLRPRLAGVKDAMCTPSISFGLGFPSNCRSYSSLLITASGPAMIAVSAEWLKDFEDVKDIHPETYALRLHHLESEYREVYNSTRFRVFLRRDNAN